MPVSNGQWCPARNVHVWESSDASKEDRKAAARFVAELDDTLRCDLSSTSSLRGLCSVVHQQLQGEEGEEFLQLFRALGGIKYVSRRGEELQGSSLQPRTPGSVVQPLLFAISEDADGGPFRVAEVPLVGSSLDRRSCFILDNGDSRIIQVNSLKSLYVICPSLFSFVSSHLGWECANLTPSTSDVAYPPLPHHYLYHDHRHKSPP